ncbi:hypothetical protein CY34DRAFT_801883 [Suillus luteus UH-Slu-Lm8-n1]|uniref:Uncharacterized protein n=1 Tax=Suillus luteus UH-Slu-Lm8-n1 TaxID=930992 RepID=A0A0D0AU86_9AGAM|nr:hypothetical protein CY34DRAFT_801883 [Suillus luteus UH-Slu-Lm8-n1]
MPISSMLAIDYHQSTIVCADGHDIDGDHVSSLVQIKYFWPPQSRSIRCYASQQRQQSGDFFRYPTFRTKLLPKPAENTNHLSTRPQC